MKSPSSAYITSFNDVTTDNLSTSATELLKKLQKGSHMAIDFEFTGMLKQKFQDMNHRYVGMKEAVERYSIVSFGLSVMKQTDQEEHVYECDNFEFLCRKNAQYVFEDGNIEFLTSTGFSFERLRAIGIPFTPPGDIGNEDYSSQNEKRDTRLIMLWKQILLALDVNKIPVIVHNGLYDIMYLYHSFIGKLPNTYSQFLSKLSDNFPAGFYDTKLLATESEFNATFLSYVFAKTDRLRQNRFTQNSGQYPYFEVTVNKPANSDTSDEAIETTTTMTIESVTESIETSTQEPTTSTSTDRKRKTEEITTVAISNSKKQKTTQKDICSHFAERGWCTNKDADHSVLGKQHDLQRIMDYEMGVSLYPQVYTSDPLQMKGMERAHAAHFDAYMTAFIFCYFKHSLLPETLQKHHNKIRLDFFPFALALPPPNKKK